MTKFQSAYRRNREICESILAAMKKKPKTSPCESCGGCGWHILGDDLLERCDYCQKYDGDLSAAVAFFGQKQQTHYLAGIMVIKISNPISV